MNDFPRRNRVDLYTPAERAISDAIRVVEEAGAHVHLTDAVILLGQAQRKVADFVDGVPVVTRHDPRPGTGTPHRWNPRANRWEFYTESWGGWCVLRTGPGNRMPPMSYDEGATWLEQHSPDQPIVPYEAPTQ